MDSVRSSSPLFSGSDRVELRSVAQGNLISFDPEEESRDRANVIQDKLVSTSQDSIPCAQGLPAQTMPDSLSQGIQTSLVSCHGCQPCSAYSGRAWQSKL